MLGDAIFDLDGTLVDSAIECAAITNLMRKERGFTAPVSAEVARRNSSYGGLRMVAALLGEGARQPEADLAEFRARYRETPTPPTSLFPGVLTTLKDIRSAGVRLSVCSAKPQALCESVLDDVGLSDLFSAILGSSPDRVCKPDPGHLLETLQLLGGRRDRSCLVGDSEVDHALARNADVPLIWVSYGYGDGAFDRGEAVVAETFSAVRELVTTTLNSGRLTGSR